MLIFSPLLAAVQILGVETGLWIPLSGEGSNLMGWPPPHLLHRWSYQKKRMLSDDGATLLQLLLCNHPDLGAENCQAKYTSDHQSHLVKLACPGQ